MNPVYIFFFSVFFCASASGVAQTVSPLQNRFPTQQELNIKFGSKKFNYTNPVFPFGSPEQDCSGAIAVCQQTYSQPNSYVGYGNVQEVYNTCLLQQEKNSVWYVFTVQNSGTFGFLIQTQKDYDFALYDITTIGCAGVPAATPVRCNYSATYGNTGMDENNPQGGILSYDDSDQPIMPGTNVTAGTTYVLIVDNFTGDNTGYTITFGGTAQIFDTSPPSVSSASACTGNTITVNFTEPIECSSIALNGSDFTLVGPNGNVPLLSASGVGCGTLTSQLSLVFSNIPAQPSGAYTLTNASSSILDKCGIPIVAGGSVNFNYLASITITTANAAICAGNSTVLSVIGAPPSGATYLWSTGSTADSVTVSPSFTTVYGVTVTFGGCVQTAVQTVTIASPPTVNVNPLNVTLCSGTTSLTATAALNGTTCTNCTYAWTGSATQNDVGVPSSTVAGAGIGSYTVTVSSSAGCVGNFVTATVSGSSSPPLPSCNILYVSSTATGTESGLTKSSPTSLAVALNLAQCNNVVIKMAEGTYTIGSPITNITSFMALEGGYNSTFTSKSSQAGKTIIFRNNSNVQGQPASPRLIALEINGQSAFRLQDLTIQVDNAPAATGGNPLGVSTYGIHLTNCSNYDIVRCQVITGNASAGLDGNTIGSPGSTGGNGSQGGSGSCDGNFTCCFGSESAPGGNGGAGGTGFSGVSGGATNSSTTPGNPGTNGTGRNGGGGGAGGKGGGFSGGNNAVNGSNGGGCASWGQNTSVGTAGGGGDPGGDGSNGGNGNAGNTGTTGSAGTAGIHSGGYFQPGGVAGTGGDGDGGQGGAGGGGGGRQTCAFCDDGPGNGGGGGGGGGQGGTGGSGGYGGGGSLAVYLFNNGTNGKIIDCNLLPGNAGTGGTGASGGGGGGGGTGGSRNTTCSSEIGEGGKGGDGGIGGIGGTGGTGATGLSQQLYTDGTALATNTILNLSAQQEITMDNISCTGTNINFATTSNAAWNFGGNANPSSLAGTSAITQYLITGWQTVIMNSSPYTGFANILVGPPTTGAITSTTNSMCPGTNFFSYNQLGNTGLIYNWSVSPPAAIDSVNAGSTNITFDNTDTVPITYTVSLDIISECCGPLSALTYSMNVNPVAPAPTVLYDTTCDGGTTPLIANASGVTNFYWYDAATGGTLLGSGQVLVYGPINAGDTVFVESTNASGCNSPRTPVPLATEQVQAPQTVDGHQCDTGIIYVNVNPPIPGATSYNWYDQPTGGTLLQSGTSFSYGVNLITPGSSDTVYVAVQIPGCPEGLRALAIATLDDSLFSYNPDLDTICYGGSDTLDIGVSGAYGNYSYLWSPVTSPEDTLANPVISGLTISTSFNVNIISGTCTTFTVLPLMVAPQIQLDSVVTDASCNAGSDGIATVTATGGASPYSFVWSNGDTSATADSLPAGTYFVTMTDAIGCLAYDSAVVSQPSVLSEIHSSTSASCAGANDGTATVNPSGGTIPYSYLWPGTAGNQTSPTATGLTTGVYTVTVTDAKFCTIVTSVQVNALPAIILLPSSTTNQCYNDSTGSASVMTVGGTLPYTYLWNTGAITPSVSGLPSSVYTVTVTDAKNCSNTVSITLDSVPEMLFGYLSDSTSCFGSNNGNSTVSVTSGGNAPYLYLWANGQTTQTATGLDSGFYSVTVTDFLGCKKDTTLRVGVLPPMVLNTTSDSTSCFGSVNGFATIAIVSGGNTPYTYLWNNGQTTSIAVNLDSGYYSVTVTDSLGCKDSTTVRVGIDPSMVFSTDSSACKGWYKDGTASVAVASGGNSPFTYLWNTNPVQTKDTAIGLDIGTYKVVITDSLGCKDSTYITVGSSAVKANFGAEPITGTPPLDVVFTDSSKGNIYTYSWNFGNNISSSSSSPSTSYTDSGSYVVLLIVANQNGICKDTISLKIMVEKWEIPNIFTPNGDDMNDVFTIKNISIKTAETVIYNRWGQKIYSWTDLANGFWDGRTEGGELAPAGVYYYIISATGEDGKEHAPLKGTVTLTR